jgi:formate hydrogenlyase subunit 6/NADH:ubiquinone oxidoreductase subunit I
MIFPKHLEKTDMNYKNFAIYFYSGTGNSFRVAKWLHETASDYELHTTLQSIESSNPQEDLQASSEQLVAFTFPTHAITAPWYLIKKIASWPRKKGAHAICISTKAVSFFKKWYLPGISGSAYFIIALLLMLKGYKIRGLLSVSMPSNWTVMHPSSKRQTIDTVLKKAHLQTQNMLRTVLFNQSFYDLKNFIPELCWGIIGLPFSILYLTLGRFYLSKLFFANINCTGCGLCTQLCPVHSIQVRNKNQQVQRPFWKYTCQSCMRCVAFCPRNCVEISYLWAILLFFIISWPLIHYLPIFKTYIPSTPLLILISFFYFYANLFLSYHVFYTLTRIPAVNKFLTYTTPTHYYKHYHEPQTSLSDLL